MSRLLVVIRGDLTQTDAGRRAGLSQSKVSRAEAGRFPLSADEADAYARTLGATQAQRRRLVELAEAFAAANITTRATLVRSARATQERVGMLEADSTLIRSWQPEIIPGMLQTEPYTAAVIGIGPDPGPEWLAARATRRATLGRPGRNWHQLVSEAALRWPLTSPEVMAHQLDHLIEVSRLPNVQLGILDFGTPKPIAPPAAFHLFGGRTASVATEVGTSFVTDPHDLDHFEGLFAALDAVALYGDDARALLTRIADQYRSDISTRKDNPTTTGGSDDRRTTTTTTDGSR